MHLKHYQHHRFSCFEASKNVAGMTPNAFVESCPRSVPPNLLGCGPLQRHVVFAHDPSSAHMGQGGGLSRTADTSLTFKRNSASTCTFLDYATSMGFMLSGAYAGIIFSNDVITEPSIICGECKEVIYLGVSCFEQAAI